MWNRRNGSPGSGVALAPPGITEATPIVIDEGRAIAEGLWPLAAEVHLQTPLPAIEYPQGEFRRLVGILIRMALTASAGDGSPQVSIGSMSHERVAMFSVHSPLIGAFSSDRAALAEAKAIAVRNGGRLWVDGKCLCGSVAYFTVPLVHGAGLHS